jgi:hypothetical protein
MFVRAKNQNGRPYHYLVVSERQGNKVRQRTVGYLGKYPSMEIALVEMPAEIKGLNLKAQVWAQRTEAIRARFPPAWNEEIEKNGGIIPQRKYKGSPMKYDLFMQYWSARKLAESHEKWARELSKRLSDLHAIRSA